MYNIMSYNIMLHTSNINDCTCNCNSVFMTFKDFLAGLSFFFLELTSVVPKLDSWDILGSVGRFVGFNMNPK